MSEFAELGRKLFYRVFCVMALIIAVYLIVDLYLSHTLDIKVIILFGILLAVIFFGWWDWLANYSILKRQEEELKIYKLYIHPLEELTKDIRARQHEFDNHMNAVLNMHVTIDNYDELVAAQKYMRQKALVRRRFFASLIRFLPVSCIVRYLVRQRMQKWRYRYSANRLLHLCQNIIWWKYWEHWWTMPLKRQHHSFLW